jgi:hypothetical protein
MARSSSIRLSAQWWGRQSLVGLVLVALLTACGGSGDKPKPTATTSSAPPPVSSPAATPPPSPVATPSPAAATQTARGPAGSAAAFPPGMAQTISDGVCQAQIPYTWVDNGTGRGTTTGGARYVLFGGSIPDDAAWQQAVALVKQYAGSQSGAQIQQGDDFIQVMLADDAGFEYRGHFGNVYCDFSVTSRGGAIPETERGDWEKIIGSLAPADQR